MVLKKTFSERREKMARIPNGPIPGENFTKDTKNFPWHRPPEFSDLDKAVEAAMEKLTDEESSVGVLTMLELGVPVSSITEMFIMSGVSMGKWTVDTGILLAGPVSHIICLMAKGYDIEYDLGIDKEKPVPTKAFFSEIKKIDKQKAKQVSESVESQLPEIQEQATGFLSMNKSNEVM